MTADRMIKIVKIATLKGILFMIMEKESTPN